MGASEGEELQDEEEEEDGDEGTTTSGEEIDRPDKDAERDNDVSDGDEDVDWDTLWGGGGFEADEWESGGSNRDKDE